MLAARSVRAGTSLNCAGGARPWETRLSCEEFDGGRVWECDPATAAKGDQRAWWYRTDTDRLSIGYRTGSGTPGAVDNLWVDDASSALFIAANAGAMELVALRPDDSSLAVGVVRVPGQEGSEATGPWDELLARS